MNDVVESGEVGRGVMDGGDMDAGDVDGGGCSVDVGDMDSGDDMDMDTKTKTPTTILWNSEIGRKCLGLGVGIKSWCCTILDKPPHQCMLSTWSLCSLSLQVPRSHAPLAH